MDGGNIGYFFQDVMAQELKALVLAKQQCNLFQSALEQGGGRGEILGTESHLQPAVWRWGIIFCLFFF